MDLLREYGVLTDWVHDGHHVMISGNCLQKGEVIWVTDVNTGRSDYVPLKSLSKYTGDDWLEQEQCIDAYRSWARSGDADAMWWLGWWFGGTRPRASVWYYVAAIRKNPSQHRWALSRIAQDSVDPYLGEGVEKPDMRFIYEIPEFMGKPIGTDWEAAMTAAESAACENPIPAKIYQATVKQSSF